LSDSVYAENAVETAARTGRDLRIADVRRAVLIDDGDRIPRPSELHQLRIPRETPVFR
jgi:hypothetical protein